MVQPTIPGDNNKKHQQFRGVPVFGGPGPHAYYNKPKPATNNDNKNYQNAVKKQALQRVEKQYTRKVPN